MFYPHERTALFVDGQNIRGTAKALGFDIDWQRLHDFYAAQATLVSCSYFTTMAGGEDFNPVRPLVDWLDNHGWLVVTNEKDTTVDLAVAMVEMADAFDHFVLASGNSVFCPVVESLRRQGRRVTILSSRLARACSDQLRCSANAFQELDEAKNAIARAPTTQKETA